MLKHVAEGLYHHTSTTTRLVRSVSEASSSLEDDACGSLAQASGSPRGSRACNPPLHGDASPTGKRSPGKRSLVARVLKRPAACSSSSADGEGELEHEAEHQLSEPSRDISVRKMRIQDAIALPAQHGQSVRLGRAPARPLCLLSARLAALGSSVIPE